LKNKPIHKAVIAEFLNPDTKLRIVRIKGNEEVQKVMTVAEWRELKKNLDMFIEHIK